MSAQVCSLPYQIEVRKKPFLECKSIDLSYKLCLTCGCSVNYYKSIHHPIVDSKVMTGKKFPTHGNREHPVNFQNKSVRSPFNWVPCIFSSRPNWRERLFLKGTKRAGGHLVRLAPRVLGCYKRWKGLSFREIWNNSTPPLLLLDPFTNKHCRTWSSMINLWIPGHIQSKESCCQEGKGLAIT